MADGDCRVKKAVARCKASNLYHDMQSQSIEVAKREGDFGGDEGNWSCEWKYIPRNFPSSLNVEKGGAIG